MINHGVGSATTAEVQSIINMLLNGTATPLDTSPTSNTGGYNPPYALDTDTILGAIPSLNGSATLNFGPLMLSGWTVLGAHFGNNIDTTVTNVTGFWLINLGSTPTNIITLSDGRGSSNAQIFATGNVPAVPEPATWAMMLLGFGTIGVGMRRRRRQDALMQIA